MRFLYLLTIAAANVLTAKFSPFVWCDGLVIIPVGSFLIGSVFVLRDIVQVKHGRRKTYLTIFAALILSAAMSLMLGDTAHISFASAASFLASEAIDTEVFSRLRRSMGARVLFSGIVGGTIDSALFVILGLSPVGSGVLTWKQALFAIIGQAAVKTAVQAIAAMIGWSSLRRLTGVIE